MEQITDTNSPLSGGGQPHRTRQDWDQVAYKAGHLDMKTMLQKLYLTDKLSSIQVAALITTLGHPVSAYRIRQMMRRMKIPRREATPVLYGPEFWKGTNWKLTDMEIADEKEVDSTTVRRWREKLGKKRVVR